MIRTAREYSVQCGTPDYMPLFPLDAEADGHSPMDSDQFSSLLTPYWTRSAISASLSDNSAIVDVCSMPNNQVAAPSAGRHLTLSPSSSLPSNQIPGKLDAPGKCLSPPRSSDILVNDLSGFTLCASGGSYYSAGQVSGNGDAADNVARHVSIGSPEVLRCAFTTGELCSNSAVHYSTAAVETVSLSSLSFVAAANVEKTMMSEDYLGRCALVGSLTVEASQGANGMRVVQDPFSCTRQGMPDGTVNVPPRRQRTQSLQCPLCFRLIQQRRLLMRHVVCKHARFVARCQLASLDRPSGDSTSVGGIVIRKWHRCRHCPKRFRSLRRLFCHRKCHYASPRCVCAHCGTVLCNISEYSKHLSLHRKRTVPTGCPKCSRDYCTMWAVRRHREAHRKYDCRSCKLPCSNLREAVRHFVTVHSHKKWSRQVAASISGDGKVIDSATANDANGSSGIKDDLQVLSGAGTPGERDEEKPTVLQSALIRAGSDTGHVGIIRSGSSLPVTYQSDPIIPTSSTPSVPVSTRTADGLVSASCVWNCASTDTYDKKLQNAAAAPDLLVGSNAVRPDATRVQNELVDNFTERGAEKLWDNSACLMLENVVVVRESNCANGTLPPRAADGLTSSSCSDGAKVYPCRLCTCGGIYFTSLAELSDHWTREHSSYNAFKCRYCAFSTKNRQNLFIHVKRRHAPSLTSNGILDISPPSRAAEKCGQMPELNGNRKCAEPTTTLGSVADGTTVVSPRTYPCSVCGREFSARRNMVRHGRLVHEGAAPFWCDCGRSFKMMFHLKRHMRLVHNNKDCTA